MESGGGMNGRMRELMGCRQGRLERAGQGVVSPRHKDA